MKFVIHMTSAHPRDDTRIWSKMCVSLAANGYRVALVVADGRGGVEIDGIKVFDVGASSGRFSRMFGATRRVYRSARAMDGDIYHFHDPELLPWGVLLACQGKKVIYDAHEDIGRDVLSKRYLPKFLRRPIAQLSDIVEKALTSRLSGVVGATSTIATKFNRLGVASIDINNYPIAKELIAQNDQISAPTKANICYVGGIAVARGIRELVSAMSLISTDTSLLLAGECAEPHLVEYLQSLQVLGKVNWVGQLDRQGVRRVLSESIVGVVTLHPTPAYLESMPIKMFEYMSAGLPIIASDFPLWRNIITQTDCGLLVDPLNPNAIAKAVDWLVTHPEEAVAMGRRGQAAVAQHFNWESEREKLVSFYSQIASQ